MRRDVRVPLMIGAPTQWSAIGSPHTGCRRRLLATGTNFSANFGVFATVGLTASLSLIVFPATALEPQVSTNAGTTILPATATESLGRSAATIPQLIGSQALSHTPWLDHFNAVMGAQVAADAVPAPAPFTPQTAP
ncbi:MAG: hypothetical protein AAFY32_06885, partial [Pseudomonadota bacterium]